MGRRETPASLTGSPTAQHASPESPKQGDVAAEEEQLGSRYFTPKHLSTFLKWSLSILLVLFLSFVVFGVLYSGLRYHRGAKETSANCESPFGTILGASDEVIGYSNCNSNYISSSMYRMAHLSSGGAPDTWADGFTGLQWQCVEYARRYWMLRGSPEPAYFGDVDGAADIWRLSTVQLVRNASMELPLYAFPNGRSVQRGGSAPQKGDLLIYPRDDGTNFPYGHVAVIVLVEPHQVYVAEQNWLSKQWPAPFHNYTRSIPLRYEAMSYFLDDPDGDLLGWMRYGSH